MDTKKLKAQVTPFFAPLLERVQRFLGRASDTLITVVVLAGTWFGWEWATGQNAQYFIDSTVNIIGMLSALLAAITVTANELINRFGGGTAEEKSAGRVLEGKSKVKVDLEPLTQKIITP